MKQSTIRYSYYKNLKERFENFVSDMSKGLIYHAVYGNGIFTYCNSETRPNEGCCKCLVESVKEEMK